MAAKKKKQAKAKPAVKIKKVAKAAAKPAAKKKAPPKAAKAVVKKAVSNGKKPPAPVPKKTAATKKPMPVEKPKAHGKEKEEVLVAKKPKQEPEEAPAPAAAVVEAEPEEVVLTDAEGRRYCRVKDCDQVAVVDAYCRYHYLLFWKKIQVRKKILSEGKLERYIEELTARYPDKFLDMLRKDLRSEKEFLAAIQELEIDESAVENEFEEETQTFIDEVRGMSETVPAREEEEF